MTNTMTTREFYQNVLNVLADCADDGRDAAELYENKFSCSELHTKAVELLAALDARNEKRKSTDTKEKKEAAARRELVFGFLKEQTEPVTRDTIAEALEMEPSKVTGACSALVKAGLVTKSEVKVDKARKVAYAIA